MFQASLGELIGQSVAQGDIRRVTELLEAGVSINTVYQGLPLIHIAALYGHTKMVGLLISRGADTVSGGIRGHLGELEKYSKYDVFNVCFRSALVL